MFLRTYLKVTGIAVVHAFAVYTLLPVLAAYFSSLGYSDQWISLIFGLFPLAVILTSSMIGEVSDSIGRTWTIRIALLLNIAAYGFYMIGAPWAIIVGRLIDGVCFSTVTLLLITKAADSLEDKERGQYTGMIFSLEYVARLIAPILGGALADHFIGYPFFLTMGLFAALVFMLRDSQLHTKKPVQVNPLGRARWFLANEHLRPMALLGPAMNATMPAFIVFLPLMIIHQFGLSYTQVGLAMSVFGAAHLLQFFFGHLSDAYGRKRLLLIGTFIYGLSLLAIAFTSGSYVQLLVLLGIAGIGSSLWNVVAINYLTDIAKVQQAEGAVMGTYVSIAKIGDLSAYILFGLTIGFFGYNGVFFALGLMILFSSTIAAYLFYRIAQKPSVPTLPQ
jgi:MFS family permease